MSTPVPFLKPLSLADRLVIDTVTRFYEGQSSPWIVWEDEHTVKLMVPDKYRRVFHDTKALKANAVCETPGDIDASN